MSRRTTKIRTELGGTHKTVEVVRMGVDEYKEAENRAAGQYGGTPPPKYFGCAWVSKSSNTIYVLGDALSPKEYAHLLGLLYGYEKDSWWVPSIMNPVAGRRWWDRRGLLTAWQNREVLEDG